MADTGWLPLATFTSTGSTVNPWTNPSNAGASDNVYATQPSAAAGFVDQLQGVNLSAPVPGGATIDGIEVSVEAKKSAMRTITFDVIQLIVGGSASGSNLGTGALTTTETVYTFGGPTNKWGLTPTDSDVNGATFGFTVRVLRGGGKGGSFQSVDQMLMKIYYTTGGGGGGGSNSAFFQLM